VKANPENIYLTNGASEGIRTLMTMLIRDENDGILIPIP
jgi:aspartate/methionine/tyrosine aminotransferase